MPTYRRGDVVWAKAEKSAEGGYKERPVVIIAKWPCDGAFDYLAMICSTSGMVDPFKFEFSNEDFESGGFPVGDDEGWIRPTYLTVVKQSDILDRIGTLKPDVFERALGCARKVIG